MVSLVNDSPIHKPTQWAEDILSLQGTDTLYHCREQTHCITAGNRHIASVLGTYTLYHCRELAHCVTARNRHIVSLQGTYTYYCREQIHSVITVLNFFLEFLNENLKWQIWTCLRNWSFQSPDSLWILTSLYKLVNIKLSNYNKIIIVKENLIKLLSLWKS